MATFDLGRVTPIYKGDYSASTSYELNDVVLYNGSLYWHVQATATVGILPTDATVWKLAFADEGVRAEIRGYADNAQASADSALASKSAAATSASNASASASQAALSAQAAQSAETGATASAQTASAKASESSVSAQSAASSAQSATDKATLASQKAAAASESASLATAKANAAATSETNAVTAAQTATTKASEAAASATSAQEYDESAQQSAVNAQTAQGLAETAQTGAETAQGLAEDARDLAQQYAESIDPEHIFSAYPTDTASGAVVSFMDGADDIPLKSLVVNIDPVQSGSGDPSPDNVRPISGWTGANVVRTGINQWDEQIETGIYNNTGKVWGDSYWRCKNLIPVVSGQTYKAVKPNITFYWYGYADTSYTGGTSLSTSDGLLTVPDGINFVAFAMKKSDYGDSYQNDIALNYPSTVTDYEPYNGQTIPIDWHTEAGTVYGGKLDVLSGELVVDRKYEIFDGSADESWYTYSSTGYRIPKRDIGLSGSGICNLAPTVSSASTYGVMFSASADYIYFFQSVSEWGVETVSDLRTWLASNNVEVCYELATPITIQLTPHEVRSLLGQNNIFADTGDSAVEYRADTKLYIERLTEPDADMIADANIVSGQYFMVGNTLYKATANIASGSAVIVGTNATRKSLSEALNEINS